MRYAFGLVIAGKHGELSGLVRNEEFRAPRSTSDLSVLRQAVYRDFISTEPSDAFQFRRDKNLLAYVLKRDRPDRKGSARQ